MSCNKMTRIVFLLVSKIDKDIIISGLILKHLHRLATISYVCIKKKLYSQKHLYDQFNVIMCNKMCIMSH